MASLSTWIVVGNARGVAIVVLGLTILVASEPPGIIPFLNSGEVVVAGLVGVSTSSGSPEPTSIGNKNGGILACGCSVMAIAGGAD